MNALTAPIYIQTLSRSVHDRLFTVDLKLLTLRVRRIALIMKRKPGCICSMPNRTIDLPSGDKLKCYQMPGPVGDCQTSLRPHSARLFEGAVPRCRILLDTRPSTELSSSFPTRPDSGSAGSNAARKTSRPASFCNLTAFLFDLRYSS